MRTITSAQSRRSQKLVTFGEEADAALHEYVGWKPKTQPESAPTRPKRSAEEEHQAQAATPPVIASDGYEISDFIDRSQTSERTTVDAQNNIVLESTEQKREKKPRDPEKRAARKAAREAVRNQEPWGIQRSRLKEKFPEGWNPRKKLSPDAMDGIRGLHAQDPAKYSTPVLAEQFKVSPEAIRRILKSKWMSKQEPEKMDERRERWAKRHDRIWDQQSELGLRPKREKTTEPEDPDAFDQDMERKRILGEMA